MGGQPKEAIREENRLGISIPNISAKYFIASVRSSGMSGNQEIEG